MRAETSHTRWERTLRADPTTCQARVRSAVAAPPPPRYVPAMSSPTNEQIRPVRVAEHAGLSDTGLERDGNEDAYVENAPLFAVCDGMGGAKAGEIASGIAADTLEAAF